MKTERMWLSHTYRPNVPWKITDTVKEYQDLVVVIDKENKKAEVYRFDREAWRKAFQDMKSAALEEAVKENPLNTKSNLTRKACEYLHTFVEITCHSVFYECIAGGDVNYWQRHTAKLLDMVSPKSTHSYLFGDKEAKALKDKCEVKYYYSDTKGVDLIGIVRDHHMRVCKMLQRGEA